MPETPEGWRMEPEMHGELMKRFGELDANTRRLTREVREGGGVVTTAKFLALHEHLNQIIERSLSLERQKGYLTTGLVDFLHMTVTSLHDGLTEGEDREVQERISTFSIEKPANEMPLAIDQTIKKMTGSAGERRPPIRKDYSLKKETT